MLDQFSIIYSQWIILDKFLDRFCLSIFEDVGVRSEGFGVWEMKHLYFDSKNWCRATSHTCLIVLDLLYAYWIALILEGEKGSYRIILMNFLIGSCSYALHESFDLYWIILSTLKFRYFDGRSCSMHFLTGICWCAFN